MTDETPITPELEMAVQVVFEDAAAAVGGVAPLPVVVQMALFAGISLALADPEWARALVDENRLHAPEGHVDDDVSQFGPKLLRRIKLGAANLRGQRQSRWN